MLINSDTVHITIHDLCIIEFAFPLFYHLQMENNRAFGAHINDIRDTVYEHLQRRHLRNSRSNRSLSGPANMIDGIRFCIDCIKWDILNTVPTSPNGEIANQRQVVDYLRPRLYGLIAFCDHMVRQTSHNDILAMTVFYCKSWAETATTIGSAWTCASLHFSL